MIKANKGISLVSLIITIAVMMIIASVTISISFERFEINNLNKMINDLELLEDKVSNYYLKYNVIPIVRNVDNNMPIEYTTISFDTNVNDEGAYYIIDLKAMDGISLNYGKEGLNNDNYNNSDDVYIINEKSHQIYYVRGIELDGKLYHSILDDNTDITIANDKIPPSKPEMKIISGTMITDENENKKSTTAVEIEIIPGKDNISGVKQTTYSINDGEETNINTLNNNILKLEENGKYEVKVRSRDNNDNVSDYNIINIEIKKVSVEKGDFIEYNVGYTDMYIAKDYTPQNGWRLMDYTNNENGTYSNVKIISTGIPAKLFYDNSDTINNSWFITDETKLANFREILGGDEYGFYTGTYDYIGLKVAAGLYYNFADLKFAYATEKRGGNLGYFNSIINNDESYNSSTTLEVNGGDLFLIDRSDIIVRLSTITEMNQYLNRIDIDSKTTITAEEDVLGMYKLTRLRNITDMKDYVYSSSSYYWLASPHPNTGIYMTNASYLTYLYDGTVGGTISGDYGIRPVICFSNNVQFVDENNDGVLEIK